MNPAKSFSAALALSLVACAHGAQTPPHLDSALRFRNADIVTAVTPGPAIPRPLARPFDRSAYFFDAYLGQRTVRALSPSTAGRAGNVNALDEVPDSSWFENRIGSRPISPEDLRRGPAPPPTLPFRVIGSKVGGTSPGIRVRDAAGVGYLLKFDRSDEPDSETAADVLVQRLLWAAGYQTAEDAVVYFRDEDLIIDGKAKVKDPLRGDRPMTAADLRAVMALVGKRADGGYRGLASKLLSGIPVGGYAQEGVRQEDPSDVVPHEDRRELRGARVFFSWVNHVDMKEDNVLDMWNEEPRTPGAGQIHHHLVDFGNSLGIFHWQAEGSAGFTQLYDVSDGARSLVSFGLWRRPWEGLPAVGLPGMGNFESARFDPAAWKARYPWAPFERFDRFDGFWAARILMRFSPAHVAAAVAEGRYQDPRSTAYMTRTLIERQRKIGRYHLARVNALDGFLVEERAGSARLCFEDLLVAHFGAEEPQLVAGTRHHITAWDHAGRLLPGADSTVTGRQGCAEALPIPSTGDGYTIVDIATQRGEAAPQRILIHLARSPLTHELRVIGVRRL
jgi:hypothetical protein